MVLCFAVQAQDTTGKRETKKSRKEEKRQRTNTIIKQEEEGVLDYNKQSVFGVQLRTNGYGAFYELGRRQTPRWTNLYSAEITEIKHPKEEKLGSTENFFSNSFIYGKINNFYQVKLGFGRQYIFGQKGNKNGVAVTGSMNAGLSIGLLKPYYLQVVDGQGNQKSISYEQDSVTFIQGDIIGGAGLGMGWSELKVKPGAFAKAALRFDFGRYNESVQALEIGISADFYSQKIPIMVYNDNKQLFYQGHIAFVFGRRK
jgi:hypothetical protein